MVQNKIVGISEGFHDAAMTILEDNKIILEAANPNYEPIELSKESVVFQGKLLAVWRKV